MRFWHMRGFIHKAVAPLLLGSLVMLSAASAISAEFRRNGFTVCKNPSFDQVGQYRNKITNQIEPTFSPKENRYAKTFYIEYSQTREDNPGLRDILNSFTPLSGTVHDNVDAIKNMLGILVTMEDPLAKARAVNYFVNVAFAYDKDKAARLGNIPAKTRLASPLQTIADGKGACGDTSLLKIALLKVAGVSNCAVLIVHMLGFESNIWHAVPALAIPEQKKLYFINNFHLLSENNTHEAKQLAGSALEAEVMTGPKGIYDDVFAACDRDGLIVYETAKRNNQPVKRGKLDQEKYNTLLQNSGSDNNLSSHDRQAFYEIKAQADKIFERRELERLIQLANKSKKEKEKQLARMAAPSKVKQTMKAGQAKKPNTPERLRHVQSDKSRKPSSVHQPQKTGGKPDKKQHAKRPLPKTPGKVAGMSPSR